MSQLIYDMYYIPIECLLKDVNLRMCRKKSVGDLDNFDTVLWNPSKGKIQSKFSMKNVLQTEEKIKFDMQITKYCSQLPTHTCT